MTLLSLLLLPDPAGPAAFPSSSSITDSQLSKSSLQWLLHLSPFSYWQRHLPGTEASTTVGRHLEMSSVFSSHQAIVRSPSSRSHVGAFDHGWRRTCLRATLMVMMARDVLKRKQCSKLSPQGSCSQSPRNPRRDKLPGNGLGLPAPSAALGVWKSLGCSVLEKDSQVLCSWEWVAFFARLRILGIWLVNWDES